MLTSETRRRKQQSTCLICYEKTRVAPKKTVSIPRLELVAATISVKIGDMLKKDIEYHHWTDSKVVLGFLINESPRFHTYVANRIQLIHEHSTPSQWHYVKTASNTADEESRKMSPKDGEIRVDEGCWLPEGACRELAKGRET